MGIISSIKQRYCNWKGEQQFQQDLIRLQAKDHGRLGDDQIRLDIVGLTFDLSSTNEITTKSAYQSQVWQESSQWRQKKVIFVHNPKTIGQSLAFEGYEIAHDYPLILALLPTSEYVLIYKNTLIFRCPNLEDLAQATIERKFFESEIYTVFERIGKRHLLCRQLPEDRFIDLTLPKDSTTEATENQQVVNCDPRHGTVQ